ncbi:MAG: glutaredoxin family protein [Halioglobus sp.]
MSEEGVNESQMLVLYGTEACHLCDQAEALLVASLSTRSDSPYRKVDISTDDALFERYGWIIPVIARPDGKELNWPFDSVVLDEFLG